MTTQRKDMIKAFKLYYSNDKSATVVNSKEYKAVENCLFIFKRVKNGADILKAFTDVYIKADSGGKTSERVQSVAAEMFVTDETVYRLLHKAEEIYAKEIELLS